MAATESIIEQNIPHGELHVVFTTDEEIGRGIEPMVNPIRGGTDGAGLSWKGLPCPNISAGGFNAHSVREWIPVEALERMTGVLITLVNSFIL